MCMVVVRRSVLNECSALLGRTFVLCNEEFGTLQRSMLAKKLETVVTFSTFRFRVVCSNLVLRS